MTEAEARWLTSVIDDLRAARLTWNYDQLVALAISDLVQAENG